MSSFDEAHFGEFLMAAHATTDGPGHRPFPWQVSLARQVVEHGRWPETIDVPTGMGKTTLIDIATYIAGTLGVDGAGPGRRRTFFAIDRRVVVDEAYDHAGELAANLAHAVDLPGPLGDVARGLRSLVGDEAGDDRVPLQVTRMRGGVSWSWRWLDRPDQPAIVIGTVDQLGSRFLFNGYGVGPRLRPIDAALVGTDSLMVVDEAHLARPFVKTVQWAGVTGDLPAGLPLARPTLVTMSATPPRAMVATDADGEGDMRSERGDVQYRLDPDEHRDGEAARRLWSAKDLRLVALPGKGDPSKVIADLAIAALDAERSIKAVGVVCNTVGRARQVAELIHQRTGGDEVEVGLLTGRVRPFDATRLKAKFWPHLRVGRDRAAAQPAILVTTQTIEVGVNVDFDALISESAPIDALVQRIGRLNRLGQLGCDTDDNALARAIVVHHAAVQPLYGAARDATWAALAQRCEPSVAGGLGPAVADGPSIPVGPMALRDLVEELTGNNGDVALTVDPVATPALYPELVTDWAHTSPTLQPLADVAPYLHGLVEETREVSLVWRADLEARAPVDVDRDELEQRWQSAIDRLPPRAEEQLAVPIGWFSRWVKGAGQAADFGDTPDRRPAFDEPDMAADSTRPPADHAMIWRGPGDGELVPWRSLPECVRPGDLVVVPSHGGGCDEWGWHPASGDPVRDIAEAVAARPVLRLDERTLADLLAHLDSVPSVNGEPEPRVAGSLAREQISAWSEARGVAPDENRRSKVGADIELGERVARVLQVAADEDELDVVVDDLYQRLSNAGPIHFPAPSVHVVGAEGTAHGSAITISAVPPSRTRGADGAPVLIDVPAATGSGGDERRASMLVEHGADGAETGGELAASSTFGSAVSLEVHLDAVGRRARAISDALGLPADVSAVVEQAARFHDLGKQDGRFQVMLHRGDDARAGMAIEAHQFLAKSGMDPTSRDDFHRALKSSQLPRGFRHEAGSAQVAAALGTGSTDRDLFVHLVASHHGCARPLLPAVLDTGPPFEVHVGDQQVTVDPRRSIDTDHPARFRRLLGHYGPWGLAMLETVVRLADIGCSEEGT